MVLTGKSHLAVLGLSPGTAPEHMRRRFRQLAVRLHPDKQQAQEHHPQATEAFRRVQAAYSSLQECSY